MRTDTTASPNMIMPCINPSWRFVTAAAWPVSRPATYIAMMVRMILQIAIPAPRPATGTAAFARLGK